MLHWTDSLYRTLQRPIGTTPDSVVYHTGTVFQQTGHCYATPKYIVYKWNTTLVPLDYQVTERWSSVAAPHIRNRDRRYNVDLVGGDDATDGQMTGWTFYHRP